MGTPKTVFAVFIWVAAVAAGRQHQLFKIQTFLNMRSSMLRTCWAQPKSNYLQVRAVQVQQTQKRAKLHKAIFK